jgi:hypothetical protein
LTDDGPRQIAPSLIRAARMHRRRRYVEARKGIAKYRRHSFDSRDLPTNYARASPTFTALTISRPLQHGIYYYSAGNIESSQVAYRSLILRG